MLYIGNQIAPVPGKLDELTKVFANGRTIAEANGAQLIGGFQVTLGPDQGNLVYIVGYADDDAFLRAGKALADAGFNRQIEPLVARSSSWVLELLPEAALQMPETAARQLEPAIG
jgi:hypothetical protein